MRETIRISEHLTDPLTDLVRDVVARYEAALQEHGPTAQGMHWNGDAAQRVRFKYLCQVGRLDGMSICDVGCGAGHLYDYLLSCGLHVNYTGYDLSEGMIAAARTRHPDTVFEVCNIVHERDLPTFDYVVCSGAFNLKLGHDLVQWEHFVHDTIGRMFSICREGIAFNILSDHVDYREQELYYSNPSDMIDFCRRYLHRRVTLLNDCPPYNYTLFVHKGE